MEGLIIFVVIVLISTAIGAVSQVLKNQQQAEQTRAARARANARAARPVDEPDAERRGPKEMDRFLEEIDRLRQKNADQGGPPVAKPARPAPAARRNDSDTDSVPTVKPAKKARPAEPAPRAARALPPQPVSRSPRLEDLPVAPVVTPPASGASKPSKPRKPAKIATTTPKAPATPFAAQLTALLSSPQSMPMAVVLTEVLGPPKCKRSSG